MKELNVTKNLPVDNETVTFSFEPFCVFGISFSRELNGIGNRTRSVVVDMTQQQPMDFVPCRDVAMLRFRDVEMLGCRNVATFYGVCLIDVGLSV